MSQMSKDIILLMMATASALLAYLFFKILIMVLKLEQKIEDIEDKIYEFTGETP